VKERAQRAIAECRRIAAMSEEPGRITRRFLTPPVHQVHKLLGGRMEALGLRVQLDAAGNLRGLWEPSSSSKGRLILGSHIDTVPDAGAFDGVLGVTLALEWVELAQELGLSLPLEVIAFSEEEGMRFGVPFLGSRAVAGRFDPALLALEDGEGRTVDSVIRAFGLDPAAIGAAAADPDAVGMVEIHIEQGPVLEQEDLSLAAVTGIVGQSRHRLNFIGRANHAGTTPMRMRHDALAACAEWISSVETLARRTPGLVATVGRIEVEPNVGNVIAGRVRASLEVRHGDDSVRLTAVGSLLARAEAIARERGLGLEQTGQMDQPAVAMDPRLTGLLAGAIEDAGQPVKRMESGAGHDAMMMASRMPAAMLFLRSPGGISHHPDEAVRDQDVEAALLVGARFLERLSDQLR
jgi:allantoate deiminase